MGLLVALEAPTDAHEALRRAPKGFEIAMEANVEGVLRPAIDHIAHTRDLVSQGTSIWPDRNEDGNRLSDHFGVWGDFGLSRGFGH